MRSSSRIYRIVFITFALGIGQAFANTATTQPIQFTIPSFPNEEAIPYPYAFCVPAANNHIKLGSNINPALHWSNLPAHTKSLAIIAIDTEVPADLSNANKTGVSIAKSAPRVDFYHWVLVDIPPSLTGIREGQDSDKLVIHGKQPGLTTYGVRGLNSYTKYFTGDTLMSGNYGGYDGPCPPWNDEQIHQYHFHLYALNVKTLGLKGTFDGPTAMAAMHGHIIGKAEWIGTYSLNPTIYHHMKDD